jgi:hypothetical protein
MIKKSFIELFTALLLVFSILAETQFAGVEANPYSDYPPVWKLMYPQNNTVINTRDVNFTLVIESVLDYDYYYSIDVPITVDMRSLDGEEGKGKVPINVTLISEKPLIQYGPSLEKYQCNIQLQNLSDGQHVLTLWHGYYDFILTDWRHENPSDAIIFSIDTSAPSLTPTPTTPYLPPNDRNAPHLEPTFYLLPISVIVAIIVIAIIICRRGRLASKRFSPRYLLSQLRRIILNPK